MAHFAQLDHNNIVKQVIVISNDDMLNQNGLEDENIGINLCKQLVEDETSIWKQTSYNSKFRHQYAGIGDLYLEEYDAFVDKKPYDSWILNTSTLQWDPPVPYPENYSEFIHSWDEQNLSWISSNT